VLMKRYNIDRTEGHVVKVSNFLFIIIVQLTILVLLSLKKELINDFFKFFCLSCGP